MKKIILILLIIFVVVPLVSAFSFGDITKPFSGIGNKVGSLIPFAKGSAKDISGFKLSGIIVVVAIIILAAKHHADKKREQSMLSPEQKVGLIMGAAGLGARGAWWLGKKPFQAVGYARDRRLKAKEKRQNTINLKIEGQLESLNSVERKIQQEQKNIEIGLYNAEQQRELLMQKVKQVLGQLLQVEIEAQNIGREIQKRRVFRPLMDVTALQQRLQQLYDRIKELGRYNFALVNRLNAVLMAEIQEVKTEEAQDTKRKAIVKREILDQKIELKEARKELGEEREEIRIEEKEGASPVAIRKTEERESVVHQEGVMEKQAIRKTKEEIRDLNDVKYCEKMLEKVLDSWHDMLQRITQAILNLMGSPSLGILQPAPQSQKYQYWIKELIRWWEYLSEDKYEENARFWIQRIRQLHGNIDELSERVEERIRREKDCMQRASAYLVE